MELRGCVTRHSNFIAKSEDQFQQRLGNESMRRFDACALCLNSAREPLACNEGHLFCKECVYTDLCERENPMR
jgi:nitric oxide synthase-interacting protein